MKLLILIVAYNHEAEIESVLSRIPESLRAHETEVLILDDSSKDKTFEKSAAYAKEKSFPFKLTVLYNPVNQGYGGNQKIGYHYAIENGFDVVAMVHGDGQYAPECLPDLLEPFLAGEAEAVFGSRMLNKGGAIDGGMPLYKFVGNKILTFFQNAVLRAGLSEFHSGYRLYSVPALAKVPFPLNTNDFHFDTEIIIQFMRAGHRIVERPIPTFYGDEICNVDGIRYALDVFKATTIAGCQDLGIFHDPKYDRPEPEVREDVYPHKAQFRSAVSYVIESIEPGARVLCIGDASAAIGTLIAEKGGIVTTVAAAPGDLDTAPAGLPKGWPSDFSAFDYVLLGEVIERLSDPVAFVDKLYESMGHAPNTELIVTSGNVAFFVLRIMLLFGYFNYAKRGTLDRSHRRLFTFSTLRSLFTRRGFDIVAQEGLPAPYPLALGDGALARGLLAINAGLIRISKGLFSFEIVLRLKPRPSLAYLLARANERRNETPADNAN
ncbi:MAG: glycosyltransferase [Rhodospirillales bacterium]|nr:glycosyltransferase [Rhodospirillales bacterium]